MLPNAQTHLPPEAAARYEQRLEAVRCSASLGWGCSVRRPGGCPHQSTLYHGCALRCPCLAPSRCPAHAYLITSSAWKRMDGGRVRPRAWAVLRLMTSSNFVGCSTGNSVGLVPFRILST